MHALASTMLHGRSRARRGGGAAECCTPLLTQLQLASAAAPVRPRQTECAFAASHCTESM